MLQPLFAFILLLGLGQLAAAEKAGELPPGVKVLRDVEYSRPAGHPLLLDLYLPEKRTSKPLPVILWVHGGGWKNGSKDRCPATWLVPEGYAVASINYRLIPDHQWPAQMHDCRAAVRWLRAYAGTYGLHAGRIGAWGSSAGGHLVALMGTVDTSADERVQAVIDWFGPSDLLTMPPNVLSDNRTREDLAQANGALLLGGIVMDQPEKARAASALHHVSSNDAPFLIMHGTADEQVPVDQSQRLHDRLLAARVPSTLHLIPGAGHGGKEFSSPQVRQLILTFLDRHLKSPPVQSGRPKKGEPFNPKKPVSPRLQPVEN
ncbi:alpha/beta hydrolase [Prosthecobacter sp. SYSU 5D2]|uniref:alpha/beta hydrolase n=1 Tax=Prosthecobacter sp. SYSU 5D2 TaxID=3134134 RepID=UPI0031FE7668